MPPEAGNSDAEPELTCAGPERIGVRHTCRVPHLKRKRHPMKSRMMIASAVALVLGTGAAFAQQEGLVNVSVDGNTVQVPVTVAVQVCADVDVNVLSEQYVGSDEIVCEIDQETAAEHNIELGDEG
jgi:hypothetical protein